MVNSLVKTGTFQILGVAHKDGNAVLEKRPGTTNELHGMLGFIDKIDFENDKTSGTAQSDEMSSSEKVYRKFLIYTTFYAAQTPVVICEGDTDNVYLTHSIRRLAAEFPTLAEVMPKRKIRLKVRLYKYPHSSTARLLELKDGGSGVLSKFISTYRKETDRFTGPGLREPVVILYDNDPGADNIRNAIKSVSKVRPTGAEPFSHIIKNLYAVPTPLEGVATSSKIEDFFDAATKATVIDGKTFDPGNSIDRDKHYSKTVFAHKVVRPKAATIDFTGFRPLLTNLTAAINKHKASVVP